ncbi:MAG: hypothetical protein JXB10_12275 [Pirellulales bacterium]|nr:hypothetical protein [Pirellulales bacterium]
MRVLILTLLTVMGMMIVPAGIFAGCSCGGVSAGNYYAYCGPACYGPPGFCLVPGCCECPPTACDNAWAGYCQEKARWQAFWTRVGTPRPPRIPRHCYCWDLPMPATEKECDRAPSETPLEETSPEPASSTVPGILPSPPSLPVPAVPPERTTRRVYSPWMR